MKPALPPTPIRAFTLARFVTWARRALILVWSVLLEQEVLLAHSRDLQIVARRHLHALTIFVAQIIFLRATRNLHLRSKSQTMRFSGRKLPSPGRILRALMGSRFRKSLRHANLRVWLATLVHALAHIGDSAAALTPRLKRNLSRLFAIAPAREYAPCVLPPAILHAITSADTS